MTPKEKAIVREVGCPKLTCRARPGQMCRREFRRTPTAPVGAVILKHPHKERRDYYNGADKTGRWVISGHAKCLDPPEGCGKRTEQWEGKGPAVIHHLPDCPIEAEARAKDELGWPDKSDWRN